MTTETAPFRVIETAPFLATAAGSQPALEDGDLRAQGVAGFAELLDACVELGVRVLACAIDSRAVALTPADLRPDIKAEIAGLVTLYAGTTASSQLVVI